MIPRALRRPPPPEWLDLEGCRLAVRTYGAEGTGRPVVLLHGLQSHSGWFVASAERVAALGLPVHAFDRCGSGLSEGPCAPGVRLRGLLEEIDGVADHALTGRRDRRFHLIGHCFGALPALLYAGLHRPERVAGLALSTPALFTRTDVRLRDRARTLWGVLTGRPVQVPVPMRPEEFSELEPYVEFVRADPLSLRTLPARLLYELARARRRLGEAARRLHAPVFAAFAEADTICDNARTRTLLEAEVRTPLELREYAGARHILEFSRQREEFLADLTDWLARRESAS